MHTPNLIFQPKGTDDLDKEAVEKYSRVLLNVISGKSGDYYKLNERFEFTDSEIKELSKYYQEETELQLKKAGASILRWFPLEFNTVNGMSTVKISYIRVIQSNKPVFVQGYKFFNDDETIEVTLSYRQSETDVWKSDFDNIIKTFQITNRKL